MPNVFLWYMNTSFWIGGEAKWFFRDINDPFTSWYAVLHIILYDIWFWQTLYTRVQQWYLWNWTFKSLSAANKKNREEALFKKKNIIKDDGVHCRKNVQKFWVWSVIMRSCEVVSLKTSLSPKALYVVWINRKIILPWFWCHNLFALWGFWLSCIRSTVEDGLHWVSFLSHPGLLLAWCCV